MSSSAEPQGLARQQSLAVDQPKSPASVNQAMGPLGQILSNPKALDTLKVDTLERLYELHERDQKRQAEAVFARELTAVQAELEPVKKEGENKHTGSWSAKLEHVQAEAMPKLSAHGFSISFSTAEPWTEGMIRHKMVLRHCEGHSETHYLELPPDGSGAKGGRSSMNILQGRGSSQTYAARYLLMNVLGVQTFEDNDGNAPIQTVSEHQARELQSLLDELGPHVTQRFLAMHGIEHVSQLAERAFRGSIDSLEKKRSAR